MGGGRRARLGLWLLWEAAGLHRKEKIEVLGRGRKKRGARPRKEIEGFPICHFRILDGISKRNLG